MVSPLGAQDSVFLTDFTTTVVNPSTYSGPTETSLELIVGATKDHGLGVVDSAGFSLDLGSTSAAFVEAAGRFTEVPIALTEAGDYIQLVLTFTNQAGILQGNSNSSLALALMNSGDVNPPEGVTNQIRFDSTGYTAGGIQNWVGYTAGIENAGGTNRFFGRPAQAEGSNNAAQELLFTSNTGAFTGALDLLTNSFAGVTVADGTVCTLIYTATLTQPGTLDLAMNLYEGTSSSGTFLASVEGSATADSLLTTSFDAIGLGYIRKGVSGNSRITFTSLEILTNKPNFPARIESGPSNLTITSGESGSLSVVASGNEPISYQWFKGSTEVPGATTNTLSFTNADSSIEGTYYVEVSNTFGHDTSPTATVSVTASLVAPSIQEAPVGAVLVEGDDYTFTVLANGSSPLSYDWQKNGVSLGAPDQATLELTDVTLADAGDYKVVVTNTVDFAESTPVTLEIWSVPTVTSSPQSTLVDAGAQVVLSVAAEGVPTPTYRWFHNGVQVPEENGATLTLDNISGTEAGSYYATAENQAGSDRSEVAQVNVRSDVTLGAIMSTSGTTGLSPDQPIELTFSAPVRAGFSGKIEVRDNSGTLVDTLDFASSTRTKSVGGLSYNYDPVLSEGNTATIVLHTGVLAYGTTYYMTIEPGALLDQSGATFVGVDDSSTIRFTTRAVAPAANAAFLRVAQDGSGDFATVQGAIDHVPSGNTRRVMIYIEEGTYRELLHIPNTKPFITLKGASRDGVVVSYLNNANRNSSNQRASFWTRADDLTIDSMTFVNTTPKGGSQAETLNSAGDRVIVRDSSFISLQDTLKLSDGGVYFHNCYIEGDVDFLWDDANAYFGDCTIHSVNKGYLVQTRTAETGRGYVFVNCRLTGEEAAAGTYLGRIDPGVFPFSSVAYINCAMGPHIASAGWLLNNASVAPTVRFYEYGSTDLEGNALDLSGRLADATVLDEVTAAQYRDASWVTGFAPFGGAWKAGLSIPQASGWAHEAALGWLWTPAASAGDSNAWVYCLRLNGWVYAVSTSGPDDVHFYAVNAGAWFWSTRRYGNWVYRFSDSSWHLLTEAGLQ
jgi:hypothetical protein